MPRSPASSAIRVARCGRSQLAQAQLMLPQHRHLPDADDAHCVAGNHRCGDLLVEGRNATEPRSVVVTVLSQSGGALANSA